MAYLGEQLAGSGLTASRDRWHQTSLFLINKWRKTRLGTTRNVLQHSLCLGSIYFSFVGLHFRHFEQSMFFESHIFKPTVCLAQEPELVLAIGQELQKIQLVDNQSLNNIERKLPLLPNLSASCVGQCCRKGTWRLGGVLLWQKASLGVEVQLSSVSLLPHHLASCWWALVGQMYLKYFAAASFDFSLLLISSPTANEALNFILLLTLALNLAGAEPLTVFLWPLPRQNTSHSHHLCSLCFPFATPF